MKILFTAFKGIHNTSFQLIDQVNAPSLLLTNSFSGLKNDILPVNGNYDAICMFGVDKALVNEVRIESCANYNGETIRTDFKISILQENLKNAKITYTVSQQPTHYLCNAAYYHMLKKNPNTVFIHIPSIKGMTECLMKKLKGFCLMLNQSDGWQ